MSLCNLWSIYIVSKILQACLIKIHVLKFMNNVLYVMGAGVKNSGQA